MKLQLCAPAVLQQLLAVISSQQSRQDDEDALAAVKNASDLINTILTGGKLRSSVGIQNRIRLDVLSQWASDVRGIPTLCTSISTCTWRQRRPHTRQILEASRKEVHVDVRHIHVF